MYVVLTLCVEDSAGIIPHDTFLVVLVREVLTGTIVSSSLPGVQWILCFSFLHFGIGYDSTQPLASTVLSISRPQSLSLISDLNQGLEFAKPVPYPRATHLSPCVRWNLVCTAYPSVYGTKERKGILCHIFCLLGSSSNVGDTMIG